MAIAIRTMLVGDFMCFLLNTIMIKMLENNVIAKMTGIMYP